MITWEQFTIGMLGATVIYYGYVGSRFFRKDILQRFSSKGSSPVRWTREETPPIVDTQETATHGVHELLEELKEVFAAAGREQLHREQIDEALRTRLSRYASLEKKYGDSINRHLVNEFSLQLDTNVTTEEMNALWK